MEYRGYKINVCEYGGFEYSMQDGDNLRWVKSVREAKEEIDTIIFEQTIYEVEVNGFTSFFQWLTDAVGFATRTGGTLRNEFDSI